jgi:hypothetical protein
LKFGHGTNEDGATLCVSANSGRKLVNGFDTNGFSANLDSVLSALAPTILNIGMHYFGFMTLGLNSTLDLEIVSTRADTISFSQGGQIDHKKKKPPTSVTPLRI